MHPDKALLEAHAVGPLVDAGCILELGRQCPQSCRNDVVRMVVYVGDLCGQRNLIDIDHQPLTWAWLEIAGAVALVTGNTTDGLGWPALDQLAPDRSRVLIVLQILQQRMKVMEACNWSFRDIEQEAHLDLPNTWMAVLTDHNLLRHRRVGS